MHNHSRFRMAKGAELLGRRVDSLEMQVSIPLDDEGFLGRQCPECSLIFRMNAEEYKALPEDLTLWCVYCGHHTGHSEFLTVQQRNRLMRAVGDLGIQMVGQGLERAFGRLPRGNSRSSSVSITYESQPFYPRPLPGISEEPLARVRTCPGCSVQYAVFGEHRYCPVCGRLPATSVAFDALEAEKARLDALEALPHEAKALLREQGVFTRNWVDTMENVVGVVEALASSHFRTAVPNAEDLLRGKGNIFQRLDDTADLFVAAGYADLRIALGVATWQRLTENWATRHLFTHNDGVVDEKYLTKVPTSSARIGQRLVVTDEMCRRTLNDTRALCEALVALAP
ncbi:hypothetical protein OG241_26940 [Streptomyces sp. NBC_01390]|uniref:hypothetical protein n=1 Tax=Streptomyces sp. NBC_01390 TaxID=2903850 RepID=UPI00324E0886